jgi:DNA-binding Lrp family transcriptional regulator
MGLSNDEYVLLDYIHRKATYPKAHIPGWCNMGNKKIGDDLGVSRKTVTRQLDKLERLGFVILSDNRNNKKCTENWFDFAYRSDKDRDAPKCPTMGQSVPQDRDKVSQHIYSNNKQTKEGTKKAKELAQIIEKNTKRLIVFCNNDKEQLQSMVERALFKGDPLEQIPAFVEHNCDNFMFRSSPESFFIRKFTQWLRYAKGFNRKKRNAAAPAAYNDILGEYYEKELDPKYLKRAPERYKGFATEYTDKVVRMDVDRLYASLSSKNKTYTPYFIYDVCYGSLAAKAGTRPDRRFSKFKQWYEKLTDYRKNQDNLRQQFQKHLSK